MEQIYYDLREKLDNMGSGYPATESGIEMKILKKLFSEDDARLFVKMTPLLESPDAFAKRVGMDETEAAEKMEDMASRGLLFRQRKENLARYSAIPFVVGIFEFQVNSMDEELAKMTEEYIDDNFGKSLQGYGTPVMRTIPIQEKIDHKWPIAPYEDVLAIIDAQRRVALAPCVCRVTAEKAGQGCDHPQETCLIFGAHADFYIENGLGREISHDDAKEVIRKSEEAGLVLNPYNSQKVGGVCSCCGCSCGILKSLKRQESPAKAVQSNYYVTVDADSCTACMVCEDRCQMEAIAVDEYAVVDLNRCIGCGLCVTTCPAECIELVKKPEEELYTPPANGAEQYMRLAQERGTDPFK